MNKQVFCIIIPETNKFDTKFLHLKVDGWLEDEFPFWGGNRLSFIGKLAVSFRVRNASQCMYSRRDVGIILGISDFCWVVSSPSVVRMIRDAIQVGNPFKLLFQQIYKQTFLYKESGISGC